MNPRLFVPVLISLLFLTIPTVSLASANWEIVPWSAWTLKGTLPIEGAPVEPRQVRLWHVSFVPAPVEPLHLNPVIAAEPEAIDQRPTAYQYSDFYNTRRKIHMIASYATIPLFVGEVVAGQKLYEGNGSSSAKSAHSAFAAGLAGLFVVNSVTGVWNLWEGRSDPNGRTRRIVHSLMMLGADAGFAATAALAPETDDGSFSGDRSAHRNMAIASVGLATASYVYMLVTR